MMLTMSRILSGSVAIKKNPSRESAKEGINFTAYSGELNFSESWHIHPHVVPLVDVLYKKEELTLGV